MKLNLGCGNDIKNGWINLDIINLPGVDIVADINKSLPFEDDYFDEIYASHCLEHCFDKMQIIQELWRVSKNGAIITILVPDCNNPNIWQDPTHKTCWHIDNFDYFATDDSVQLNPLLLKYRYYSQVRFKILQKETDGFVIKWQLQVVK